MNAPISRAAEGFDRRAFTVSDVLRMIEAGIIDEEERFELIEGEIVPMSPKGNQHEVIKAALNELIAKRKPDNLRLAVETTLYLADDTFVEPDLCVYPRRILPEDVNGTDVLLAIEVAGSSLGYERGLKARLYAKHGVRELWVIDAAKRVTWIHQGPISQGTWASIVERKGGETLTTDAVPSLSVVVDNLD
jgi:Uma2 family endonuclease